MKKVLVGVVLVGALSVLALCFLYFFAQEEKVNITTETIPARGTEGRILKGENTEDQGKLGTNSSLVFESPEIDSPKPQSNAAVLKWDQTEGSGEVHVEFRTYNGHKWSEWVHGNDPKNEAPDHAPTAHNALILADSIKKIQYRFELSTETGTSPTIDVAQAQIELIDSTRGPSPTKQNFVKALLDSFSNKVTARADGPRIYTRAEWGSPEPDGSPSWEPEYRELHRIVVHHTATTMQGDPAAAIRAIWQFHTHSNGWGDIGYNYLVDGNGNIYQGRYFDKQYAEENRVDVVGGHALTWNFGSTGIAALGDFSGSNGAPEPMLRAIGDIAAFKIHRYGIEPSGFYGAYPVMVGHKDILATACPANVHGHLPSIRTFASREYAHYYQVDHQDYAFRAQGKDNVQTNEIQIKAGETANVFIDIRNTGIDTWRRDGSFPIRLGAKNPRDRHSVFATGSWINPGRPASFSQRVTSYNEDGSANVETTDEILPGQVARFAFPLKAPEIGGSYIEYFQPVIENYAWFIRDFNMYFKVNVEPRNFAWHGISQVVYTDASKNTVVAHTTTLNNLRAGQRYYVEVKVKNDGNQIWVNDGANPMRLGTYNPADRPSAVCDRGSWPNGCHRAATMQESEVGPNGVATFGFWVDMPYHTIDRQFREYFNIVSEGLKWGQDQGMFWQFNVDAQNLIAYPTSIRGFQDESMVAQKDLGQLAPNERFYIDMHIRNDGNVTWQPTGLRQVRLGTTEPTDRKSLFCANEWVNPPVCNRITVAEGSSVPPGQIGAYRFWMKAPAAPGTYTEYVNLVAEGFSWFRNSSIPIVVTVR